jgi:hypothetical protein
MNASFVTVNTSHEKAKKKIQVTLVWRQIARNNISRSRLCRAFQSGPEYARSTTVKILRSPRATRERHAEGSHVGTTQGSTTTQSLS